MSTKNFRENDSEDANFKADQQESPEEGMEGRLDYISDQKQLRDARDATAKKRGMEYQHAEEELKNFKFTGDFLKDAREFLKAIGESANLQYNNPLAARAFQEGDMDGIFAFMVSKIQPKRMVENYNRETDEFTNEVDIASYISWMKMSNIRSEVASKIIDAFITNNEMIFSRKKKELSDMEISGNICDDAKNLLDQLGNYHSITHTRLKNLEGAIKHKDFTRTYDALKDILREKNESLLNFNSLLASLNRQIVTNIENIIKSYGKNLVDRQRLAA
jgi:hypothetical protein